MDSESGNINTVVNFADVLILIEAFQGDVYPFGPAGADGNCPRAAGSTQHLLTGPV
ncbi:MAG: hypothetical protein IIC51_03335 [Planctomycetes bacterium]|nr:hypothetical protein [Planctomycetota bacterium]